MKEKQLIGIALLGVAAYLITRKAPAYTGPYQNIPPAPPPSSPNFQIWVNTILKTFGQVADLWKPGGPFYKQPVPQPTAGDGWQTPQIPQPGQTQGGIAG